MKNKGKYLSHRVRVLLAALFALLGLLCAAGWALCLWRGLALWPPLVCTLAVAGLAILHWQWVARPYREVERIFALFAEGYTVEGLFEMQHQMSPASERAVRKVRDIVTTDEFLNASKRQAQYLALQNQINPHFLYNTLEGIRGEALVAGSEGIAMMTEALSTFFRYTISKLENLVTLEDELGNVENYFLIQQYRFGQRLALAVEFESEEDRRLLLGCHLPKLTLQPIVENAIIHGLEGKVGNGCVTIRVQGTGSRVIVTVKDDGLGMDAATLAAMRQKLNTTYAENTRNEREGQGGIALANVNNRVHLLFGEGYGLAVYSSPGQGTDVELTLPYIDRAAARRDLA